VQQALLNNVLLYALVAVVHTASNPGAGFALLNAGFSIFAALQALACFLFLPRESILKKGTRYVSAFPVPPFYCKPMGRLYGYAFMAADCGGALRFWR
jgi:hypothetical protein